MSEPEHADHLAPISGDPDDRPVPTWQRIVGVVLLLFVATYVVDQPGRVKADFWPFDRSFVGPNIVAAAVQWAVALIVLALIWPPTRRRIHRFVNAKARAVTDHVTKAHAAERQWHEAKHAEAAAERAELQRHLRHIIEHHPDIPDLPPAGD